MYVPKNPKNPRLRNILFKARKSEIDVRHISFKEITDLCGNSSHQGIALKRIQSLGISVFNEEDLISFFEMPDDEVSGVGKIVVALDRVTDPRNAGAVIRSMGAFASKGIVIGKKNSPPLGPTMLKTSAGVLTNMPVYQVSSIWRTASYLRERGVPVIGLDMQGDDLKAVAKDIREVVSRNGLMLIGGSEEKGLSREMRKVCDHIVSIAHAPMVESLNVSVAVSIALFEFTRDYF